MKYFDKEQDHAINVYRTKKYIVKQNLYLHLLPNGNNIMFSNDIYYIRNHVNDKKYEKEFSFRTEPNGKRVLAGIYKRTYLK